jgi:LPS-assembly protein
VPAPAGTAARYRSRSRRTIRPFGPVPASPAKSTPRSPASFRTNGLAKTRPPGRECPFAGPAPPVDAGGPDAGETVGAAGAGGPAGCGGLASAGEAADSGETAADAGCRDAACAEPPSAASTSASLSPAARSTAIGSPIDAVSPSPTTRRPTTPASSAAYSTSAFSVSISASGVPTLTLSPAETSHRERAASVAPAKTLGIRTTTAMTAAPPRKRGAGPAGEISAGLP